MFVDFWLQDLAAQLEKLSLKPEPFILQPKFWEDEGGGDVPGNCAPLLNRNNGCLSTEAEANKIIIEQAATQRVVSSYHGWMSKSKSVPTEKKHTH